MHTMKSAEAALAIEGLSHWYGARQALDDVTFAFLCDPKRRAEVQSWGYAPAQLVDRYIDLFNRAVAKRCTEALCPFDQCGSFFQ